MSPLFIKREIEANEKGQAETIRVAQRAVESLLMLWSEETDPLFLDVLCRIRETGLFILPEAIRGYSALGNYDEEKGESGDERKADEIVAWRSFLETPFSQIEPYSQYIQGKGAYDTHQGIKGLEFPRVCVIMDDTEARGFTFSYEKLLGAKAESPSRDPGRESSAERTRRLFYVTCSRAEHSLALVAYSVNPSAVRSHAIEAGWFQESEIDVVVE